MWPISPELIPAFVLHEATRKEYFYSPLNGMMFCHRATPSIKIVRTHWYTWVERGTGRVKCLVQERSTMFLARVRIRTARSEVEWTNHEATLPPRKTRCNTCLFTLFLLRYLGTPFRPCQPSKGLRLSIIWPFRPMTSVWGSLKFSKIAWN